MENLIINQLKKHTNKIAYIVDNDILTYKELLDKSSNIASLLVKQGNEPVIVFGHKSTSMIITIVACIIANRTYIPIDTYTPLKRLDKIITDSKASLLIANELISINSITVSTIDNLDRFAKRNNFDCSKNNIAYIIFTSGSTGEAKGVPITYNNLKNFIHWISNFYPLNKYKNINVLNEASFSFDLSVADIFYSLYNGHTLVGLNTDINTDYNKIFSLLNKRKINMAVLTPTFIKMCLLNKDFNENNYPFLKCLYFCGEQLEISVVQNIFKEFPKIKIINAYGPTEATSAVSGVLIKKNMAKKELLPVGNVHNFATDISIINNEIVLKGNSVFDGYLNYNNDFSYKKDNTNCFRTGDLGYIDGKYLYCKGRMDSQIKYKGYRIELMDIEYNIKSINNIQDCVVIPIYDKNNNVKKITAYVVANGISEKEIINKLSLLIPNYMIPKTFVFLDKLPINNNQKIDRKMLIKDDRYSKVVI